MTNRSAVASSQPESLESFLQTPLPTTISELEGQIAYLQELQEQCSQRVKELMAAEDLDKGIVHAGEIHELLQQKNMLETHKQFRVVRRSRLRMEQEL